MTWFNNLSIQAASAAYADAEFIAQSRRKNAATRRAFLREMDRLNLKCAPSDANFVWLNTGENLADLGDKMRAHNIWLGNPRGGWARVTIGTEAEMQAFIKALKQIKS
jgi:histidinol-phosphate aminotransferase